MRRTVLVGSAVALAAATFSIAGPSSAADAPQPRHDPITVTITATPAAPKAGQVVTFAVHVASNDVGPTVTAWRYGDGSRLHQVTPGNVACFAPPTTPQEVPSTGDATFRAMYRAAGTYTFTAKAAHYEPCTPAYDDGVGRGTLTITVAGPDRPANGPGSPTAQVDVRATATGAGVRSLQANDPDGLVRSVSVSYGDGTAAQTFSTGLSCKDPKRRWLSSTWTHNVKHALSPGPHTIKLVVTSTGCGGGAKQKTTVVRRLDVAAAGGFHDTANQTYKPPLRPGPPQVADP